MVQFAFVDDVDRAFGTHDGDLGGRPGVVHVGADVLGGHDAIGAAVGFAGDDGDFGHRGFGERVEQLGAVLDDSAVLLLRAGQKAGDVFEGDQRNVEAVAEAHEARAFDRGVDVERAGQHRGLIGDDADGLAVEARESDDDVLRVVLVDLEEIAVVDDRVNDVLHVVGHVRLVGNYRVELLVDAVDRIGAGLARRVVEIVGRNETQQLAHHGEALGVVAAQEVGDAGGFVVGVRAAELVFGDLFVGDRLDDVGAGDEHVARSCRPSE